MRLQSKFLLALLPPVVILLLILGWWSAFQVTDEIHQTADLYLGHTLETYRTQDLERRYEILKKHRIEKIPSFVSLYQHEAAEAAAGIDLILPGHIFAFNREGKLIFDTQGQEAEVMESKWAGVVEALTSTGEVSIKGHLGQELYKAIRFDPWGWLVFVSFNDRTVHQSSRRIELITLLIALACAVSVILTMGFLFKGLVANPIATLRRAAREIASQKFPQAVEVNSKDELGALARDMEKMSEDIKGAQGKILGFTDKLESMVEERTQKLKESQASLAQAQQLAHLGSWNWDIKKDIFVWSDEVFRIFGLEPGEMEPNYQRFLSFVHPEDRKMVQRTARKAMVDKETLKLEHKIVTQDGTVREVSLLGEVAQGSNGEASHFWGTLLDVTERKIAEAERLHREKLQGAIETAGAVCHEMNQPLQALMAGIQLCAMESTDQVFTARLKIIDREVIRLAEITAKLQRITKYETRNYLLNTKILDLDKSID